MLRSPERYGGNVSGCSLCYSCSDVCPAKIDLGEQTVSYTHLEKNSVDFAVGRAAGLSDVGGIKTLALAIKNGTDVMTDCEDVVEAAVLVDLAGRNMAVIVADGHSLSLIHI